MNQFAALYVNQFVTLQQIPRYNAPDDYSDKNNHGRQLGVQKNGEKMDSGSTARRLPVINLVALERYICFELGFGLEIGGRPAPVLVGVSE